MRQIIYNFLDDSVGPGVKLRSQHDFYAVYSDNNTHIFSFKMKDDWEFVKLYRYEPLCRKVSSLFSVTQDEAARFISNWFGDKYGLVKVGDLRKVVPQLPES
jgi:hypothetical protein